MGNIENYNHKSTAVLPKEVDLTTLEFKKLKEFVGEELVLEGFFFSNGNWGRQVSIYTHTPKYPKGVKINMPKRYTDIFEDMASKQPIVEEILNKQAKLTNIEVKKSKNGETVIFDFASI